MKEKMEAINGRYPRYRDEEGIGIMKEDCGCLELFSPDGTSLRGLCIGHGGGISHRRHEYNILAWPTREEACKAQVVE